MVVNIVATLYSTYFPKAYTTHIASSILVAYVLHKFSQGRRTTRDRDLHGRVFLITGAFDSAIGAVLLEELAFRGAHIIALSPYPLASVRVSGVVSLLRTVAKNENIYAEPVDLKNPHSIKAFCTKFLTGEDAPEKEESEGAQKGPAIGGSGVQGRERRLDGIVFAHEAKSIGRVRWRSHPPSRLEQEREQNSLATFLLTNLLIPFLLVAPAERDIRIVNVVNPLYAAALSKDFAPTAWGSSSPNTSPKQAPSTILSESHRSLQSVIHIRHLQRILDALPTATPTPATDASSSSVPILRTKTQKSNIVAVSVSPGILRQDTVRGLIGADWDWAEDDSHGLKDQWTWLGIFIYLALQPILRIFTRSAKSGIQTVLHSLFLPTPFKVLLNATEETTSSTTKPGASSADTPPSSTPRKPPPPEEILRPGALYADCGLVSVGRQRLKLDPGVISKFTAPSQTSSQDTKQNEPIDDGEYGGELAGRAVWEMFEERVKVWEKDVTLPVQQPVSTPSTTSRTGTQDNTHRDTSSSDNVKRRTRVRKSSLGGQDGDDPGDKDYYA